MLLSASFLNKSVNVGLAVWKGFGMMSTDPKAQRLLKRIGTHSGVFHCDEALACFMLKQLPDYEDAEIVRTRDEEILKTCDIVVDVGSVYNADQHRYDHHQRGFTETMSTVLPQIFKNKTIRLSSAGLVYAHFGMEILGQVLRKRDIFADTDCILAVYKLVYDKFIEELDAIDNGVPMFAEGEPRYTIHTHLGARVRRLNPSWNTNQDADKLFTEAMNLVGVEFVQAVVDSATEWWPAREIVKNAIKTRLLVHENGEIIVLKQNCPWKEHLHILEEDLAIQNELKFVLFPDTSGMWRVQGISVKPESFVCRVFLHKDWRGIRNEELSSVAGIPGCTFCHATGFIGGNESQEGALQMALQSLRQAKFEAGSF